MLTVLGGLLIGVSLGMLGSGGSILTVPVLVYGLGHVERVAIAESLLIVGAIALAGSTRYVIARQVSWRAAFFFGIPGMAGTYAGAMVASLVSGKVQLLVFGIVMMAAAIFMFRSRPIPEAGTTDHSFILAVVQGLGVGALTGFVGVGGGFLIVPALVFLRRLPIHQAVGTSLIVIAFNASSGFVKYLGTLRDEQLAVNWMTILIFILLGTLGTQLGSHINKRLDPQMLRKVFAVFLVVMSLVIVVREGGSVLSSAARPAARVLRTS